MQSDFTQPSTEYRLHGPPGTGKSTALATKWIPAAIKRFGPESVVVVSLTKAAAQEIASRNTGLPRENVGTLHAMGYRAMGKPSLAKGDKLNEWNTAHPYWHMAPDDRVSGGGDVRDDLIGPKADKYPGNKILDEINLLRAQRMDHVIDLRADMKGMRKAWEEYKRENELCDFQDMIGVPLDENIRCPGSPRVLIVDEAQDCSAQDLALVRQWGRGSVEYFVLAGDGDQAIYGFRGGSVKAFLGTDIPAGQNYSLTQSYRVSRAVQEASSKWIARVPDDERYAVDYQPTDTPGSVARLQGSTDVPEGNLTTITSNISEGKTTMILAPCAYQLRATCSVLRNAGILFHNPWRVKNGAWNPLRGGFARLKAFVTPIHYSIIGASKPRMWTWDELHRWAGATNTHSAKTPNGPLQRGAKKLIKERAGDNDLAGKPVDTDILRAHVFTEEAWQQLSRVCALSDETEMLRWYRERLADKHRKQFEYAFNIVARGGKQKLGGTPRVVVGTVHSVKGGEADDVILYPELSPQGVEAWASVSRRSEIVRTLYVGMTRAKRNLYLCGARPGLEVPGIYNLCNN